MCKTIKQKVTFQAEPQVIYDYFTDQKKLVQLTGKKARIRKQIGSTFSTFAGAITGVVVDLAPAKRIVQAWRSKEFGEGLYSMAAITLDRTKRGGTTLVLTHRGVPKNLIPQVEKYWRKNFWSKIKLASK